jgi:hypothetical protein
MTIAQDFFKGLNYWQDLADTGNRLSYVVYGGNDSLKLSNGIIISWKHIKKIFD